MNLAWLAHGYHCGCSYHAHHPVAHYRLRCHSRSHFTCVSAAPLSHYIALVAISLRTLTLVASHPGFSPLYLFCICLALLCVMLITYLIVLTCITYLPSLLGVMFIAYLVVLIHFLTGCISTLVYSVVGRKRQGPNKIMCFIGRGKEVRRGRNCDSLVGKL